MKQGDSEKACPVQLENEEWTPYNGDLHMQGIKVIVNNPTPKRTKVDTFEGTMLLIDIYKHKMELETFEKKVVIENRVPISRRNIFNSIFTFVFLKCDIEILRIFYVQEKKIREMALQQKKKVEESRGPVVTYKL